MLSVANTILAGRNLRAIYFFAPFWHTGRRKEGQDKQRRFAGGAALQCLLIIFCLRNFPFFLLCFSILLFPWHRWFSNCEEQCNPENWSFSSYHPYSVWSHTWYHPHLMWSHRRRVSCSSALLLKPKNAFRVETVDVTCKTFEVIADSRPNVRTSAVGKN